MLIYTLAPAELTLMLAPQLASWDASTSASQQQMAGYLEHAEDLLAPVLATTRDPLALRLEVGLPADVDVLRERDLDNYLHPLVTQLIKRSGRRFASVTATKGHANLSRVGLAQAQLDESSSAEPCWYARTTASAEKAGYKQQIAHALERAPALPEGPVTVDIAFRTGPGRSWPNLWKPTIDALGGLLGHVGSRPWHPDDGRITQLGLHHHVEDSLGHDVELWIRAQST